MSSKKLTDRQIKNIIAARVEGASLRSLAKKYKVSVNTIKNYCNSDDDFAQKCNDKKEENKKTVLEHMEKKSEVVQGIIDTYLTALADPKILKGSKPKEIAIALGIIIDKFSKVENDNSINDLDKVLKKIEGKI